MYVYIYIYIYIYTHIYPVLRAALGCALQLPFASEGHIITSRIIMNYTLHYNTM